MQVLSAYRCKGTFHYKFGSQHIYSFWKWPDKPTKDEQPFLTENWNFLSQLRRGGWSPKVTGVGPLAWHCGKDFPFLSIKGMMI
jgi:hypothetical protein